MTSRQVYCEDALVWLEQNCPIPGTSLVGSLPDYSEFPHLSLSEWQQWFTKTSELILQSTPEDGVTFFFQTDIKVEGYWLDKAFLCQLAAHKLGHHQVFHKIFCRAPVGKATFGRPAYSHLLCFAKNLKIDLAKSTPDVFSDLGDKTWERGMGFHACQLVAKFIKEQTSSHTMINPFCGYGSMLAVSNSFGLNAIGIEKSRKRCEKAKHLLVNDSLDGWSMDFGGQSE